MRRPTVWRSTWSSIGTTILGSIWGTIREVSGDLLRYKQDINLGYLLGIFIEIQRGINLGLHTGINLGNNQRTI